MIRILSTATQIAELTAIIWLARIVTPRRFRNAKAISANCVLDAHCLIRQHNEMFGIWGYNLQQQTGKKKKAANAVARKLSVTMYYNNEDQYEIHL